MKAETKGNSVCITYLHRELNILYLPANFIICSFLNMNDALYKLVQLMCDWIIHVYVTLENRASTRQEALRSKSKICSISIPHIYFIVTKLLYDLQTTS
jgi:hypothetical protein